MIPNNRNVAYAFIAFVGLALIIAGAYAFWPTPQMGADKDVMSAVDALFTAVTARDERLLSQCEQRLAALKAQEKIPTAAAGRLDGIIEQSREGGWDSAARRLYSFIQAQRI